MWPMLGFDPKHKVLMLPLLIAHCYLIGSLKIHSLNFIGDYSKFIIHHSFKNNFSLDSTFRAFEFQPWSRTFRAFEYPFFDLEPFGLSSFELFNSTFRASNCTSSDLCSCLLGRVAFHKQTTPSAWLGGRSQPS